ncbi:MAG: CoB--CoM heterodisulfide reductase iron-sulfur subunit A family protein [Fidelibacterota bacterium]|nr:MAG: CoB--CoM heterodisulfide reductase iron-sulfur subunit A family protein [Candidatus Neomarinimicrobiota bacterium]
MKISIGVYICHCGSNIAGTIDVRQVRESISTAPNVVVARDCQFMCSDPGQALIKQDIREKELNRVIVAACSPLMHERTFQQTCESAGLNRYLFQMANIREHCSWVHEDRVAATNKAKAIINAAVRRVGYQQQLETKTIPINPATLIVGGGIAGIQAALEIAASGSEVYLVEREPTIGGKMALFDKTFPTLDCAACILTPKMVNVGQNPNIHLMSYSEIADVSGSLGNFKVNVTRKPRFIDEDKCNGCGICYNRCPAVRIPRKRALTLDGQVLREVSLAASRKEEVYSHE